MKYLKKFENNKEEKYVIYTYEYSYENKCYDIVFNIREIFNNVEKYSSYFEMFDKINIKHYEIIRYDIEDADNAVKCLNKTFQNRFKFEIIPESEIEIMLASKKYNL